MRMGYLTITLAVCFALFAVVQEAAADDDNNKPLIYFDKGRIGVNFLGFRAAAGLGGLLTGNAADGGLYAEAGTPFGQFAHAGVGGQTDEGRSGGGLFAGATAGNGVAAKAGLGGVSGANGARGASYAGATAGGRSKSTIKIFGGPLDDANVEQDPLEGNVQKVPLRKKATETKIIADEKLDDADAPPVLLDVRGRADFPPVYIEKTKYRLRRRPHYKRKHLIITNGGIDNLPGPPIAPLPDFIPEPVPVDAGIAPVGATKTVTIRKTINPQVINDAFNIPISTLEAVSKLVGGITKNVEVNKEVSIKAEGTKY
ncbi:unnamed protein product [Phyllotreta striolata]|uniref:Uncharacterized protein n=1 Tax=Phyllotreta striolata TaxID=444603 RepID=A0A9P0DWR9_PHYSR|nr:unnamed protein product [Phyllotreta striolata]